MDNFSEMLVTGMRNRGHNVQHWTPDPVLSKFTKSRFVGKWLGYIDLFLIFPSKTRIRIKKCKVNTLYVFTDQALGPWVPMVKEYPHVIHCHDFLALSSALGEISENRTSWTGKLYQRFIHRGYVYGKNFISVSEKTQEQLKRFLQTAPLQSTVIYNGLREGFLPYEPDKARAMIESRTGINTSLGYLLHIGGNQWYKNRIGVIEIYNAWRANSLLKLPLLLVGDAPSTDLREIFNLSPFKDHIHFLSGMDDDFLRFAYAGASVFLFPSFAEGFGWPIVEAMACGCKVITTRDAPMTEVAGHAGFYIAKRPKQRVEIEEWSKTSAGVVENVINLGTKESESAVSIGIENAKRFDACIALNKIEITYKNILTQTTN